MAKKTTKKNTRAKRGSGSCSTSKKAKTSKNG